jgi:hypothetical protein
VADDDLDSGSATATTFIVIYDASGGFVTGGGWIDSPDGAYTANPSLTGKANFGFVSKYKKGQSTPTGQTEFQFKAGDLNFHSSSYDWLVIAGAKAMYKGVGTINGGGNFGFQLGVIDAALTPSTDVDLFRIRIWDKDNSDVLVYDNKVGDDDPNSDPTTAIGGGSIKIHKGSKKIAANGTEEELLSETIPESYGLEQNYPNPFNPTTLIRFDLPEASQVRLAIYNLLGQKVRTLVDGMRPAGSHGIRWDAKDDLGQPVPGGVYLYQIQASVGSQAGGFSQVKKMSLLK